MRADRAAVVACDIAIIQNQIAPSPRERYVPLWPQPGLRPREAGRGQRIERVAYHGRHAPPWFFEAPFVGALASRGIRFEVKRGAWDDYRGVDVALASREDAAAILATKPATKLYNAWIAGVPALASPEPAYRQLRRSPIDFIEVADAIEVVRALDLLRANPGLYAAMVANGRERAAAFAIDAVRDRWIELLEGEVRPAFEAKAHRLRGRRLWHVGAMAAQKTLSRIHRTRVALQRWRLRTARRSRLAERAPHHFAHVARQPF